MTKIKLNLTALKIVDLILDNYDVKNAKDINEALKNVFGPLFALWVMGFGHTPRIKSLK